MHLRDWDQYHGWVLVYDDCEIADLKYETIDDPWWVYAFQPRPGHETACDHVTMIASRETLPETCYLKNCKSDGVLNRENCLISGTLDHWLIRDGRERPTLIEAPIPIHWKFVTCAGAVQGAVLAIIFDQTYGLPYFGLGIGVAMGFYLAVVENWCFQSLRRGQDG